MFAIITHVHVYNKHEAWERTKKVHENSQIHKSYVVQANGCSSNFEANLKREKRKNLYIIFPRHPQISVPFIYDLNSFH